MNEFFNFNKGKNIIINNSSSHQKYPKLKVNSKITKFYPLIKFLVSTSQIELSFFQLKNNNYKTITDTIGKKKKINFDLFRRVIKTNKILITIVRLYKNKYH